MKLLLLVLVLLTLFSCGDASRSSTQKLKFSDQFKDENKNIVPKKATYVATLTSVNPTRIGEVTGAVTVNIEGDFLVANVRMSGPPGSVVHSQAIHMGYLCPTEIGDENLDGYLDAPEADAYTSGILIPLDGDLNSQTGQEGMYPLSDEWGSYTYSEIASLKSLLADLFSPDENAEDRLVKLKPGNILELEEKVVVIYSVLDIPVLPESVRTLNGLTSNQSIPIACGKFKKIDFLPGYIEGDDVPIDTIEEPGRLPSNNSGASANTNRVPSEVQVPPRTSSPHSPGPRSPQASPPNNGRRSPVCHRDKTCR